MAQLEVGRRQTGCWVQSCSWIRAVLTDLSEAHGMTQSRCMAYRLKDHVTLLSGGIFNRECRCILYIQSDIDKRTQRGIKERLTRDKLTIMKHSNMRKKKQVLVLSSIIMRKKQVLELTIHKERGENLMCLFKADIFCQMPKWNITVSQSPIIPFELSRPLLINSL